MPMYGLAQGVLDFQQQQQQRSYNALIMDRMRAEAEAQQRQRIARALAGQTLYDQIGDPAAIPRPPAPPPGSMSPGGGNPMAPGTPVMAPPAMNGPVPPPPAGGMMRTGQGGIPNLAQPPAAAGAPPAIPPFKTIPTQPPPQAAPAPGMVPPPPAPPAAPPAGDGTVQPRTFDLKGLLGSMKKSGVPPDRALDMLEALAPVMNAENKQELELFKANNAALKAANEAYARVMTAMAADRRSRTGEAAEERRGDQGQQRIDLKKRELEGKLRGVIGGGAGSLKTTEYVYARGPDGKPDMTKEPIGIRGITKTGKIVNLDAEGHQVPTLAGATAKEGTKVKVTDTVRSNIVRAGVTNTLRRLDELEEKYPGQATSSFFGQHGDNPMTRKLYGTARGTMSGKQQEVDAQWASIIDEAIPVFTGGLRGSDAFRRFLIEQAPGPGDKPETIRQKIDLIRKNVEGTSHAFFDRFSSDPTMWIPGTTKDEVEAAKAGNAPGGTSSGGGLPAGIPAGAKVIGKTPGGADVYEAPDGKRYTAD
jgi:hypothetical protein